MQPKRWARVRKSGAHGLRRGAWYSVVNDSKPTMVFLDVNRKNVAMDRTLLELRDEPPAMWSVVQHEAGDPPERRPDWVDLEATYGVCPQCRSRSNLASGSASAGCGQCGGTFPIDWAHPC